MIKVTGTDGRAYYLHPDSISKVVEASSSQWHGIRSIVKTADGDVIEAKETAESIVNPQKTISPMEQRITAELVERGVRAEQDRCVKYIQSQCKKRDGAGWVWSSDLDEADEETRADTETGYNCDSDLCKAARGLEGASPMIYTTLNKIRAHGPCQDGWEKLMRYRGKTGADDEPLSLLTILESR